MYLLLFRTANWRDGLGRTDRDSVADTDGAWDWLDQAAQDARDAIDQLYHDGHTQLFDTEPDAAQEETAGEPAEDPVPTDTPT